MNMKKQKRVIDIPEVLIIEILKRLPVKPLLRFKCVEKSWCNLINSQDFVNLHLTQSKETVAEGTFIFIARNSIHSCVYNSPQPHATALHCPEFINDIIKEEEERPQYSIYTPSLLPQVIGSCNGLVCFYEPRESVYSIYNPATRAYKKLPKLLPPRVYQDRPTHCRRGSFAYDCVADDFKVFDFCTRYVGCGAFVCWDANVGEECRVYSLNANSWKVIPNPPLISHHSHTVGINNFLHWIGLRDDCSVAIIRLDVSTQRYDIMSVPTGIVGDSSRLAVLRGHLHLVTDDVDIWILKDYGVEESWTRLFHGPALEEQWWPLPTVVYFLKLPLPVVYSRDGHKILVGLEENMKSFICCDLDSQEASKYVIESLPDSGAARSIAVPWVESLVTPCRTTI